MGTWVKLTTSYHSEHWINLDHVWRILPSKGGGSSLFFDNEEGFTVEERPEEILALANPKSEMS